MRATNRSITAFLFCFIFCVGVTPARAVQVGACGTMEDVNRVIVQNEGHQIVAAFDRYVTKDDSGNALYLPSFISATSLGGRWYYIVEVFDPEASEDSPKKLCVAVAGSGFAIVDYATRRAGFTNQVEFTLVGETEEYEQGLMHRASTLAVRKAWDNLKRLGGSPSGDDPYEFRFEGRVFHAQKAVDHCPAAQDRWGKGDCHSLDESLHWHALIDQFPAVHGVAEGGENEDDYLFTLVFDDLIGRVTILYSTQQGATLRVQSGRLFTFRGWVADQLPELTNVARQDDPQTPVAPAAEAIAPGLYTLEGRNPNGSAYEGTVKISSKGAGGYVFDWTVDHQTHRGSGNVEGDKIIVNYGGPYPVTYTIIDGGALHGTWANGRGTEALSPQK